MRIEKIPFTAISTSSSWNNTIHQHLYKNNQASYLKSWVPLKEYAKFNPRSFTVKPEKLYHYIDSGSVNRRLGVIDHQETIKGTDLPARGKRLLRNGDILIITVHPGNDGVFYVKDSHDGCIGSNVFIVLKADNIEPEVLFFCLRLPKVLEQMKAQSTGTLNPVIKLKNLKEILIPKIDKELRKKITEEVAKYLSAIKKRKALEEILAELFPVPDIKKTTSFRVVLEELSGGSGLERQGGGRGLAGRWDVKFLKGKFFTESINWDNHVPLKEIASYKLGYTMPRAGIKEDSDSANKGHPLLSPKQVETAIVKAEFDKHVHLSEKDKVRFLLTKDSIVVVRIGTGIGRAALVKADRQYVAGQHLITLNIKNEKVDPEYLVYALNSPFVKEQLSIISKGILQEHVSKDEFMNIRIPLPGLNQQQAIVRQIKRETEETFQEEQLKAIKKLADYVESKLATEGDEAATMT